MDLLSPLVLVMAMLLSGPKIYECARIFTIINSCKETIWPGITPGDNFNGGGFALKSGQSIVFQAPVSWSGRIWGRTGCKFDKNGNGPCQTADCGNTLKCSGSGCDSDLRKNCPSELSVKANGKVIACRSACDVFNTDEYCCRGLYGNPVVCQPTYYSKKFKSACPTAYSYAYDDPTSIFTCSGADYVITFCSARNQPVCTYHDHKLICNNKANGTNPLMGTWWSAMLALLLVANLWFIL
ncbi:thaumatin-like protein isoform X4 [Herrania umbratica]|uniref:Thaumatin-like protein isoform X4 n=1 Tax=Herrania umbratica TaxID=108875 RepID=A0A6J1ABN3_9ROSI|nr:thaumatin-like protein isoform X4 [Herrania umbratica]